MEMPDMRTLITAIIAILGLLTVATVASADHAWSVYHWPGDNLRPTVVERPRHPSATSPRAFWSGPTWAPLSSLR